MKIVFIILAHQQPDLVTRLVKRILMDEDFYIVMHYDAKAPISEITTLEKSVSSYKNRIKFSQRIDVQWGEWSMVSAVLSCLESAMNADWEFDYVYLISAADYPIKPFSHLKSYLSENHGKEFIESFDAEQYEWVAGGIQAERYKYWHFINWRRNPKLFSLSLFIQKYSLIKRQLPKGHRPFIGSQWWTLTRKTCQKLLHFSKDKEIIDFYKRVWVPDEMYFQTLTRTLVANDDIITHSLTFYEFTDYGVPVVYCNGHEQHLLQQGFFFARKISNHANELRDNLDKIIFNDFDFSFSDNQEIGKKTSTYKNTRSAGRHGIYGKRKVGHVQDAWYGDLEWNALPYFVVIGNSDRLMRFFQKFFMCFDDVICHGKLFNQEKIDFCSGKSEFAGYRTHDLRLRDHNKQSFLSDVILASPDKTTGYLLSSDSNNDILDVHIWDSRATIFVLKEFPPLAFQEKYCHDFDYRLKDTLYANYCRESLTNYQLVINKLKQCGKLDNYGHSIKFEDLLNSLKKKELIDIISTAIERNCNQQAIDTLINDFNLEKIRKSVISKSILQINNTIKMEFDIFSNRTNIR